MRRFLVSSLLLHICALVDPSRKSTGWFVVRAHAWILCRGSMGWHCMDLPRGTLSSACRAGTVSLGPLLRGTQSRGSLSR